MSPYMWRSKVGQAVPSAKQLASTQDTQGAFPTPCTLAATLVQCWPPSRVIWTLPSSVPAQIRWSFLGDSEIEYTVVFISATELSTFTPPDSSCFCFSGSLVVRSGEIRSQDWPWSRERNTNCAPI